MNIGIYQSASALSALERWQDTVSQNIASSQITGYRKRTISFSMVSAGEVQPDSKMRVGQGGGVPLQFPSASTGIDFLSGETLATRRDLDVAIQGPGFFEVQMEDGSKAYTRNGQFSMASDRTLTTTNGHKVLSDGGDPITILQNGAPVSIDKNGTISQGEAVLGKLSLRTFSDTSRLVALEGGMFIPSGIAPQPVENPELLQGYLEGSNVTPLREMVDLVLISRAYEANQKIISTVDQQMQKTLDALG